MTLLHGGPEYTYVIGGKKENGAEKHTDLELDRTSKTPGLEEDTCLCTCCTVERSKYLRA